VPLSAKITYSAIAPARPDFVFGVTSQYRENLGILGRRSIGFRTPVSLQSSQTAPWCRPLEPNVESQPIAPRGTRNSRCRSLTSRRGQTDRDPGGRRTNDWVPGSWPTNSYWVKLGQSWDTHGTRYPADSVRWGRRTWPKHVHPATFGLRPALDRHYTDLRGQPWSLSCLVLPGKTSAIEVTKEAYISRYDGLSRMPLALQPSAESVLTDSLAIACPARRRIDSAARLHRLNGRCDARAVAGRTSLLLRICDT